MKLETTAGMLGSMAVQQYPYPCYHHTCYVLRATALYTATKCADGARSHEMAKLANETAPANGNRKIMKSVVNSGDSKLSSSYGKKINIRGIQY